MRFDEKKVLVTGASRGIGRAIALLFAGAGAQVPIAEDLPLEEAHAFALGKMAQHAAAAKAQGAQIIVFSEGIMSHMWSKNTTAGCDKAELTQDQTYKLFDSLLIVL